MRPTLPTKECWYEVQKEEKDIFDDKWELWEKFPFDPQAFDNGKARNRARSAAIRMAKSALEVGHKMRVIYVETRWLNGQRTD